jgi:PEP-CTERM motif
LLARNTKLFVFVLLAAVVAQPLDARSTQIFFAFSGEITSISDVYTDEPVPALPDWGFEIGGPFAGTLTIDTEYAASDPSCFGYSYTPLYAGTQTFKIGEFVTLPATNPRPLCFGMDPNGIFAAGAVVEDDVNLTPLLTVEFQDLHINWSEFPISSLDDLVTELDSLTFTGGFYEMSTSCNALKPCPFDHGSSRIIASFDHVKAWAVPEPSALTLLAVGLVGLGWVGRRKTRGQ